MNKEAKVSRHLFLCSDQKIFHPQNGSNSFIKKKTNINENVFNKRLIYKKNATGFHCKPFPYICCVCGGRRRFE